MKRLAKKLLTEFVSDLASVNKLAVRLQLRKNWMATGSPVSFIFPLTMKESVQNFTPYKNQFHQMQVVMNMTIPTSIYVYIR